MLSTTLGHGGEVGKTQFASNLLGPGFFSKVVTWFPVSGSLHCRNLPHPTSTNHCYKLNIINVTVLKVRSKPSQSFSVKQNVDLWTSILNRTIIVLQNVLFHLVFPV